MGYQRQDAAERQAWWLMLAFGSVGAIILGLIVSEVWFNFKYPCLEYKQVDSTCGGDSYCAFRNSDNVCMAWATNPTYPCKISVCTKRETLGEKR